MPRFAANVSMMFTEVPFLDRFSLARKAGFSAVEFMFPYDFTPAEVSSRLQNAGLELVLFNAQAGNWAEGDRGLAALPQRRAEFRDGVKIGLEYAVKLGCPRLHLMAGLADTVLSQEEHLATYAANLDWAADECAKGGVMPVIEPINHRDMPGYFLQTTAAAASVIHGLGKGRIGLQFDIYHCQVTEGDVAERMRKLLPIISHMQLADNPGRHEPGSGELNWDYLFRHVDALGFDGWIGCEYKPAGTTEAGLTWYRDRERRS